VNNLSGSGSSGNENDNNALVPSFPKGAHNTSKAASKLAIKSFRKPSVYLARLQKTKSPKSEATKQTSTMKQIVPATAGANDQQQAFAPPPNLFESFRQNCSLV
jgi:hypothetical protein